MDLLYMGRVAHRARHRAQSTNKSYGEYFTPRSLTRHEAKKEEGKKIRLSARPEPQYSNCQKFRTVSFECAAWEWNGSRTGWDCRRLLDRSHFIPYLTPPLAAVPCRGGEDRDRCAARNVPRFVRSGRRMMAGTHMGSGCRAVPGDARTPPHAPARQTRLAK